MRKLLLLVVFIVCAGCQTKQISGIEGEIVKKADYPLNRRLESANNDYEIGNLFEAEKQYLNILVDHPRVVDAWFKLGNIYYRSGRYSASVNAYESVIKINNRHEKAWYNLSLSRLSQAVEAIDYSLELIDKDSIYYKKSLQLKLSLLSRVSGADTKVKQETKTKDSNIVEEIRKNSYGERQSLKTPARPTDQAPAIKLDD